MRMLDNETGNTLENVTLYLNPDDLRQMQHALNQLSDDPSEHHVHLNDESYQRELTVAVYTKDNLMSFDERSRKLLSE